MKKLLSTFLIKKEYVLLVLICALYLIVQFPTLFNPAYEVLDDWRQSDTFSIAENYFRYDMNPLKPQFNYDGTENIYVQLELQIMPYISAVVFKFIGRCVTFVPRLISLLFYIGSAAFLYGILRRFVSVFCAFSGVLIYFAMPVSVVYSRAIMPEACTMFFYCGSVYYAFLWNDGKGKKCIWFSAVFMAYAILEKIPVAFAGIMIIALFIWKEGKNCFRQKEFWGYGVISLGIPVAYYLFTGANSTSSYVNGIATKHIFSNKLFSVFSSESMQFFVENMPMLFGISVLVFSLVGFVSCFTKRRKPIAMWAIAFAIELSTIVAIIKFGYYLIFVAPIFAVLCSIVLEDIMNYKKLLGVACFCVIFAFTAFDSAEYKKAVICESTGISEIASCIDEVTAPSDVIAVSTFSPTIINAAKRHGYRANIGYHDFIPTGPEAETEYYISKGVKCFVVVYGQVYGDTDGKYLKYLNDNFAIMGQNQYCTIYNLQERNQ